MVAQQDTCVQDLVGEGPMWISAYGAAYASRPDVGGKVFRTHGAKQPNATTLAGTKRPNQSENSSGFLEHRQCGQCTKAIRIAEQLQRRVMELEVWREQAIEDIRGLRKEHWLLKAALDAEGVSCKSDTTATTASDSASTVDTSENYPARPPSPISLVELLPSPGSVTLVDLQAASITSFSCSPMSMCARPALMDDSMEPLKLLAVSPALSPTGFHPPPGLLPPASSSPVITPSSCLLRSGLVSPPDNDMSGFLSPSSCKGLPPGLVSPAQLERAPSVVSDAAHIDAVRVAAFDLEGVGGIRAEWRIEQFSARLKSSMGKPIVSPPFAAYDLLDMRLMVFPELHETKGLRTRKSKDRFITTVTKGPLHAALKFKGANLDKHIMECYLTVGSTRWGPFSYDFSEHAMHGCDGLGVDWLKQLDGGSACIRIGLEIMSIRCK